MALVMLELVMYTTVYDRKHVNKICQAYGKGIHNIVPVSASCWLGKLRGELRMDKTYPERRERERRARVSDLAEWQAAHQDTWWVVGVKQGCTWSRMSSKRNSASVKHCLVSDDHTYTVS